MGFFSKAKELHEISKNSGIKGVRNNIQYEIGKLDEDIENRKQIIKGLKQTLKQIKSTRK